MVTLKADTLYNRLIDMLRVHQNYMGSTGHALARAAAEYEVRGTTESLAGLHRRLERYVASYERLREELVAWEADLDAFCEAFGELQATPAAADDFADVQDWVDKAARLYQPKFRG